MATWSNWTFLILYFFTCIGFSLTCIASFFVTLVIWWKNYNFISNGKCIRYYFLSIYFSNYWNLLYLFRFIRNQSFGVDLLTCVSKTDWEIPYFREKLYFHIVIYPLRANKWNFSTPDKKKPRWITNHKFDEHIFCLFQRKIAAKNKCRWSSNRKCEIEYNNHIVHHTRLCLQPWKSNMFFVWCSFSILLTSFWKLNVKKKWGSTNSTVTYYVGIYSGISLVSYS